MTAQLVGPGGTVEVDNSDAVPIEVTVVSMPPAVSGSVDQGAAGIDPWLVAQRDLTLDRDNVRQAMRPMSVLHSALAAGASDSIAVGPAERIRVLRIDGGCTPTTAAGTFPSYAITLDIGNGPEVVRGKELQPGEPIGGTFCLEGIAGADLTVTVSGAGGVVEFDIYYELF